MPMSITILVGLMKYTVECLWKSVCPMSYIIALDHRKSIVVVDTLTHKILLALSVHQKLFTEQLPGTSFTQLLYV